MMADEEKSEKAQKGKRDKASGEKSGGEKQPGGRKARAQQAAAAAQEAAAAAAERQPSPRTLTEYQRAFDLFVELHGDLPVIQIKKRHARLFREAQEARAAAETATT